MAVEPVVDLGSRFARELGERGYTLVRGVVPGGLLASLAEATDRALAEEGVDFPPGDDQHGRLLFAPAHGGPFLELCGFDPLFEPIERLLGDDSIIYTMTTSVLSPGSAGPVDRYHTDLSGDRPAGLALAAMVLLDRFEPETGATEFLPGSHRWGPVPTDDSLDGEQISGGPGDVCYFDPRVHHRGACNRSSGPRRAVLFQMVRPWMKQRFDVRAMLGGGDHAEMPAVVARRLGLTSLPPGSVREFTERRSQRPWS